MALLRFIAIVFCCVSFTAAGFAAGKVGCCMEEQAQESIKTDIPCHDTQNDTESPIVKECNCICSLHIVAMPHDKPFLRSAIDAKPLAFSSLVELLIPQPIDAPPKVIS